jgi:hypothetical protein
MSARHRKPTALSKKVTRVGGLAVAFGLGAAVANTPAVAFAEPTDSSSSSSSSGPSSSSSGSSSSASSSSSESTQSPSSTGPTSSTDSSTSTAGSSSRSTSGMVQSSVDRRVGSTSSPSDASTPDSRSGAVQNSGGKHTSSTPSSSGRTASAGATPTQTKVPAALATAAPAEPPAAAVPTEQPTAALPTEVPVAPPRSAEAVPSPGARKAPTPQKPVVTAAPPTPDAPHHDAHTARNFAVSHPTHRSGSAPPTVDGGRRDRRETRADHSTAHRERRSGGVGGQHLFGRCS